MSTPLISYIVEVLTWYETYGRHELPWRNIVSLSDSDRSYRVWLSEILLQQTQVSRVIPYYERILEGFPTIHALAHTDYDTFFPYYKGMGYYSRARNMLRTATIISEEYGGRFPEESTLLRVLPGVGKYTSEAIRAFAYDIPTLAWDTNLEKVFSRIVHGSRFIPLTDAEKKEIEKRLFHHFSSIHARDMNAALMDWANGIDLNEKSQIAWETYPRIGIFGTTLGESEPYQAKVNTTFPIPDARIIVFLHRDHKSYLSDPEAHTWVRHLPLSIFPTVQDRDIYFPFLLPPCESRDTRAYVQTFFRKHYNLEISVRPIHTRGYTHEGKEPYIGVNAQIQTGIHTFREHMREPKKR